MSKQGLRIALEHGKALPTFDSKVSAQKALFRLRDELLESVENRLGNELALDYSLESLKALEKCYFEHSSIDKREVGFYFGEVLCRVGGFRWILEEFVFRPGAFEIGIQRRLFTVMLTNGITLTLQGNKRMQSLYREAKSYLN